jgi:gliding motility-associated-like protein
VCAVSGATCLLTGTISGGAITGTWAASGSGTVNPVYTSTLNTVSTIYTLSAADLLATSLTFTLGSTGNCVPKTITVSVNINKPPTVVGSVSLAVQCKNAAVTTLTLSGGITNAAGGLWTGGSGGSYGVPGANTTYTPSLADIASGLITFSLSSQGPLPGCVNVGATYTAAFIDPPTITMATSTIACTNSQSVAVQATVTPGSSTYTWVPAQGYYAPSFSVLSTAYVFGGNDLQQPSVTLTLTASNTDSNTSTKCFATPKTIVVNIVPQPTIALSTKSVVCALAGTLNLNGTISGGGSSALTWSTSNGTGAFFPSTPASPTNTDYVLGANDTIVGVSTLTFVASSSGGFCPTVSNTITVDITKVPLITVNQNTAACQFAAITLSGAVSGYTNTGYWYSGGSAGNSAYTPSNPANGGFFPGYTSMGGQYYPSQSDINAGYVVLTLYNDTVPGIDCSGYKSFTVTFVPSPEADFNFGTKRCIGDPVTFSNISNLHGTTLNSAAWNFDNGFTSISTGSTISTYTAPGIYHITFTVTGTNSLNISCSDTVGKDISVNPLPYPDFTIQNACVGVTVFITNQSLPANGQFNWFFGSNATPSVSTAQTPLNISFNQAGTNSIDLRETVAATQCTASITKQVNVNPLPDANFGMTNNPTVAQEPVYYSDFSTPTSTSNTWYWNFGDEGYATQQNPTHTYQNGGIYYVTLTVRDSLGCTDTVTKRIEVNLIPQVPTGFTPNGDGANDRLFVKGGPFKAMKFRIYNNWGEKIYESDDQLEGWDGKKDGKDQPVGVYVWTLEVDLYNNRTVRKNGDVTLMR